VIEGASASEALRPAVRQQLVAEAKFTRAFLYFYLVNLYGELPLALTTDYEKNALLPRSPTAAIYDQVIGDLQECVSQLSGDYLDATLLDVSGQRVRPTRWAAEALLAKVYLYNGQWAEAASAATTVIAETGRFRLMTDPDSVFLADNREAIWQLQPTTAGHNTEDALIFILPPSGPTDYNGGGGNPVYLSQRFLAAFEPGDLRRTHWIDSVVAAGVTYHYPYKYKVGKLNEPVTEYLTMLRLGEMYLIRAEAKARLDMIPEAQNDLNAIRRRAGLGDTDAATGDDLVRSIMQERRIELFTEMGNRWMDLKRWGIVDAAMSVETPLKGGNWKSYQQWYPVPFDDVQKDPNLHQTQGYE
jgi:hypothetical protein